jgi:hypothetical protein
MILLAGRFFGYSRIKYSAFLSEEKGPFLEMFKVINFHRGFSRGTSGALRVLLIPVSSYVTVFFDKRVCSLWTILITFLSP